MVARDITTGQATNPVPYKKNPDYDAKGNNPEFLPAEPHIGLSGTNADPVAPTYQTGIVAGGTTNPPKGESGAVKRISLNPGDADPFAQELGGDFGAFDEDTKDNPTVNQKVLNEVIEEDAAQPPQPGDDDSKATKSTSKK